MAGKVPSPLAALNADRSNAQKLVATGSKERLQKLLRRAHEQLVHRLTTSPGLAGASQEGFTTTQLRTTLLQISFIARQLGVGMKDLLLDDATKVATQAAGGVMKYMEASERRFRGIHERLPLKEATLLDRGVQGSRSSLLNRLSDHPDKGPGILSRYGHATIESFEQTLQTRFVAKTSWADTRQQLISASPFLQGKPASWAERIVRTEIMGVHGRAAEEATKAADDVLGDVVKILCATFDDRTGADSYAVHGQVRRVAEAFEWWGGSYMAPPNRPNDREIIVSHRIAWPIPPELKALSDSEVAGRWAEQGNKGAMPRRPKMTTVDLSLFGKEEASKPEAPPEQQLPQPAVAEPTAASPLIPPMAPTTAFHPPVRTPENDGRSAGVQHLDRLAGLVRSPGAVAQERAYDELANARLAGRSTANVANDDALLRQLDALQPLADRLDAAVEASDVAFRRMSPHALCRVCGKERMFHSMTYPHGIDGTCPAFRPSGAVATRHPPVRTPETHPVEQAATQPFRTPPQLPNGSYFELPGGAVYRVTGQAPFDAQGRERVYGISWSSESTASRRTFLVENATPTTVTDARLLEYQHRRANTWDMEKWRPQAGAPVPPRHAAARGVWPPAPPSAEEQAARPTTAQEATAALARRAAEHRAKKAVTPEPPKKEPTAAEAAEAARPKTTHEDFKAAGFRFLGQDAKLAHEKLQREATHMFGKPLDVEQVRRLVGINHLPTKGKKVDVMVYANGPEIGVVGTVGNASDPVAKIQRTFSKNAKGVHVHHDLFVLHDSLQGGGTGKKVLKDQFAEYDKMGVKEVSLTAAWKGRYVWPNMGFKLSDDRDLLRIKQELKSAHPERAAEIDAAPTVQDAVRLHEGENKWAKEAIFAAPSYWMVDYRLDLIPGDKNFEMVKGYLASEKPIGKKKP